MNNSDELYLAVRATYDMLYVAQGENIPDEKVIAVANVFLENSTNKVTLDNLPHVQRALVASRYLRKEGEQYLPKVRISKFTFNGDDEFDRILEGLNGKVLHLYFLDLLKEKEVRYEIEFNVDGKGGVKLPDGSIETVKLTKLAYRVAVEHNVTKSSFGPSSWFIINDKHSEIKKRKQIKLQEYLNIYV